MHQLSHLLFRAGGGHSFSSGGGGSAGGGGHITFHGTGGGVGFVGGGGSSGGSGALGLVIVVFAAIIIFAIWIVIRSAKARGAAAMAAGAGPVGYRAPDTPAAPPAAMAATASPPPVDQVRAGLDAIKAHDPGFEEARFIADSERAFFTVQQAWTELKPDMSRRVMADGIWQQHKVQIEGYEAAHKRNVLENLAIANATIIHAESQGGFDTIVLRLLAGCADYDIDTESNKVVRGNKDFTQWTEDWCFQRSADAVTKAEGGTMQQRCPNCGAPLDLDLQGVCKYCHEAVMSGKYDWVLTRIEQVLNGSSGGGYSY